VNSGKTKQKCSENKTKQKHLHFFSRTNKTKSTQSKTKTIFTAFNFFFIKSSDFSKQNKTIVHSIRIFQKQTKAKTFVYSILISQKSDFLKIL